MGRICFFPIVRYQAELFCSIAEYLIKQGVFDEAIFVCPSISSWHYIKKKKIYKCIFIPEIINSDVGRCKHSIMSVINDETIKNIVQYELRKIEIEHTWRVRNKEMPEKNINLEASIYYRYWEEFLIEHQVDVIISWNGYLLPQLALAKAAKDHYTPIPILFCENGYENGTFVLDSQGVNSKSGFTSLSSDYLQGKSRALVEHNRERKIMQNKISLYFLLRIKLYFNSRSHKQYKDIIRYEFSQSIYRKIMNQFDVLTTSRKLPDRFIFFPLQVITDSQLLDNYNGSQESAISDLIKIVEHLNRDQDESIYLLIKDHPRQETRGYFQKLKKRYSSPYVRFIRSGNTSSLIQNAIAVVTINSSIGYQALQYRKNVFVLGHSIFTGKGLGQVVNNMEHLELLLTKAFEGHLFTKEKSLMQFNDKYLRYCSSLKLTDNTKGYLKKVITDTITGGHKI
ncbi:capsule polysaccharide modification protein KpsS [Paenibacillus sp. LBL]|uniref:capsular polysaccharide export protein, LipB/KpsS family n=1 Tax=Paenibacillus sp. LBL TaxID=2940563 RepID=UPI002476B07D|nr:hypothetical protein [Paenibacillus sp. LBL]MDH6674552.1 capsule polysaccharide modification protein KpsS [Paenibacillus sp. LBL]